MENFENNITVNENENTELFKNRKLILIISVITAAVALILITALIVLSAIKYRANIEQINDYVKYHTVEGREISSRILAFEPVYADTGLIFYPGGLVESEAYIPLMSALANEGILCVLIDMPLELAVLDVNAADGVMEEFPHITEWYIGGHSLGGSMAASYLADNEEAFRGLILLASYTTDDISDTGVDVLSLYGSLDGVLDMERYEKYKANLPSDYTEYVIEGGNHAYFGMYGEQSGDGEAVILPETQIDVTADRILRFVVLSN